MAKRISARQFVREQPADATVEQVMAEAKKRGIKLARATATTYLWESRSDRKKRGHVKKPERQEASPEEAKNGDLIGKSVEEIERVFLLSAAYLGVVRANALLTDFTRDAVRRHARPGGKPAETGGRASGYWTRKLAQERAQREQAR